MAGLRGIEAKVQATCESKPEDNVLKPGAPIFLYLLAEAMKRGDGFTEIVELQEFATRQIFWSGPLFSWIPEV